MFRLDDIEDDCVDNCFLNPLRENEIFLPSNFTDINDGRLSIGFRSQNSQKRVFGEINTAEIPPFLENNSSLECSRELKKVMRPTSCAIASGIKVTDNSIERMAVKSQGEPNQSNKSTSITRFDSETDMLHLQMSSNLHRNDFACADVQNHTEIKIKNFFDSNRRFPGPAGVLPDVNIRSLCWDLFITEEQEDENDNELLNFGEEVMHAWLDENSGWKKAWDDIADFSAEFEKNTIAMVISKLRTCIGQFAKITCMCVVLESVELTPRDGAAVVRDHTGTMEAGIHRTVVEKYASSLKSGTVLILRNISAILISVSSAYINITVNNVLACYGNETPVDKSDLHGALIGQLSSDEWHEQ